MILQTDHKFGKLFQVLTIFIFGVAHFGISTVSAADSSCANKPNGWKIEDPLDCHGFLICYQNQAIQAYCGYGEKYDDASQRCIIGKCPPCKKCDSTPPTPPTPPTPSTPPTPGDTCQNLPHGYMFRDPNDCTKFYVCSWGQTTAHSCPAGLYFDTTINVCNYPEFVDCNSGPISPTTPTTTTTSKKPTTTTTTSKKPTTTTSKTTTTTTSKTTTTTSKTTTTTPKPAPGPGPAPGPAPSPCWNSCAGQPNGYMYVDPTDCSRYYVCSAGSAILRPCPPGLYFDMTMNVCNYNYLVNCENSQTTPGPGCETVTTPTTLKPITTTTTTTQKPTTTTPKTTTTTPKTTTTTPKTTTTTPKTTTTTTKPTQSPTPAPPSPCWNSCAGQPNGYMYVDPSDCSKYYICSGGLGILRLCPTGLYFDMTMKVCNYNYLVNCGNSQTTPGPGCQSTANILTTGTPRTITVPLSDSNTYTQKPSISGTTDLNGCAGRPDGSMYRDPTDCSRFYVCSGGSTTLQNCSKGLHFDPKINVCNYPALVNCVLTY